MHSPEKISPMLAKFPEIIAARMATVRAAGSESPVTPRSTSFMMMPARTTSDPGAYFASSGWS
jgi:hypothetical protein